MTDVRTPAPAVTIIRREVLLAPDPADPRQRLGVFNPGLARDRDGTLYLFPRIAAESNYSRVGRTPVRLDPAGYPTGTGDLEIVLEPVESWERNGGTAGVEDPRITRLDRLDLWVMTYASYGPLGARLALAVSGDLRRWIRMGPVTFGYEPELGCDLNLYSNKDATFFPEPVTAPDGRAAFAMLHRPTWDLSWLRPGEGILPPRGLEDIRPGIWVSYVPLDEVGTDPCRLTHLGQHRLVALPEADWEHVKIGAGPPPVRVDDGWLLIYHGVRGKTSYDWPQEDVCYSAGAMLLDPDDVTRVRWRTGSPLLEPELPEEVTGVVDHVVFPTALDLRDDGLLLFYGMADTRVGWTHLSLTPEEGRS